MDNRIYIGIDPGKNGGIGFIYNDLAYCVRCPATVSEMAEEIKACIELAPDIQKTAIIEKVHSMPKQGVKSVSRSERDMGSGWVYWQHIRFRILKSLPRSGWPITNPFPRIRKIEKTS